MISSRKYFTIFLMMLVLFFMFQFLQVYKDWKNEYDVNEHVENTGITSKDSYKMTNKKLSEGDYVVLIGNKGNSIYNNAYQWCLYTKRNLIVFSNIQEYMNSNRKKPEMLLLQMQYFDVSQDLQNVKSIVNSGTDVTFCDLPDYNEISNNKSLRELLGIKKAVSDDVTLKGIKIFTGFLLGGEEIYKAETLRDRQKEDLELDIPWYMLDRETKTYMVGMMDSEMKNEELPVIIWKRSSGKANIFCVNGDYMSDIMGVGFLQAMACENKLYDIYPVVNAQNIVISNYPGLASENDKEMQKLYSRTQKSVFEDIIWPGFTALCEKSQLKMTMMIAPQIDYNDNKEPSDKDLKEYLKEVNEEDAEAGISMEYVGDFDLKEKVNKDNEFFEKSKIKYEFHATSIDAKNLSVFENISKGRVLENIDTIVCDHQTNNNIIGYYNENITLQQAISTGATYTYRDALRFKALETVLAYSNVHLDMRNILWPKSKKDRWENYFKEVSQKLYAYGTTFKDFESTTLSESDVRVRRFLALDYKMEQKGNHITINVSNNDDDAWFIFKSNDRILEKVSGGKYKKIEDDVYLIHALSDKVVCTTKSKDGLYYTLPD